MATRRPESKKMGQIFTPDHIVSQMLDRALLNRNILSVKIMEPSFGEGIFLCHVIERMIICADVLNIDKNVLGEAIRENIYGIEKDPVLHKRTIEQIGRLLSRHGIDTIYVPSNLICGDALKEYVRFINQMDIVVGNPPYVRPHYMDEETKTMCKTMRFGQGTTDLYVHFYDIGIQMLNDSGRLCYISPRSFMYNASQASFRKYLLDTTLLSSIHDFKGRRVFPDADTYCCVCVLSKDNHQRSGFLYGNCEPNKLLADHFIEYQAIRSCGSRPWIFEDEKTKSIDIRSKCITHLRDIAHIQYGVSTNADRVYIGKAYIDNECTKPYINNQGEKYVFFNGCRIESSILRKCIKASKCDTDNNQVYIIFPYIYNERGCDLISETDLMERFPYAYSYLSSHRKRLEARDMEPDRPWYAFARSQGLKQMNRAKLTFKHIVPIGTEPISARRCLPDEIIYSGMFVTVEDESTLDRIANIINSADFKAHCNARGKNMSNGYIAINGKIAADFQLRSNLEREDHL